jgi:hypothetical protein
MSSEIPSPSIPAPPPAYPASLKVDYPERKLNRLTSFFRLVVVIPIIIVLAALVGAYATGGMGDMNNKMQGWNWQAVSSGFVVLPLVLMILFRQKYPRWWFDWNLALSRFSYRISAYFALMRDEYPSTDEEQAVHVDLIYPDVKTQLMRGMPLIKWFLAIPHYFVLAFLGLAAWICVILAWFAILFSGKYPRGLFDFVEGVLRWGFRVEAYSMLMITDKYPPFSLS